MIFFTIVFFTAVGFMVRLPLENRTVKLILEYILIGVALILAQDMVRGANPAGWTALIFLVALVAAMVVDTMVRPPEHRVFRATQMLICATLILFCVGISYIAAASFSMLTGLAFPWPAASFLMAALVRNTTGMTDEEFPDEQGATIRAATLFLMGLSLIVP